MCACVSVFIYLWLINVITYFFTSARLRQLNTFSYFRLLLNGTEIELKIRHCGKDVEKVSE